MSYKNYFKLIGFLLFVMLFTVNTTAYNLNDAISSTITKNNHLQAAKKKLEITILEKPKAMAGFMPSVFTELDKTFCNQDDPELVNKQLFFTKGSFTFNIQQDIFTGGSTIAKIAAADAIINAAYQEYNKILNSIILKAIESYQGVLNARELVRVQQMNLDMAYKNVERAKITVKTGAETKSSLFAAKANLANIKSDLESFLIQQSDFDTTFKYFIGMEAPKEMDTINLKKYKRIQSIQELGFLTKHQNPDLMKVQNNVKMTTQGINIAASEILPKVSLFVNRSKNKYSDSHPNRSSVNISTYGLTMKIPLLYKGGIQYINVSEAKKNNQLNEFAFSDILSNVERQTNKLWEKYISSENIYKAALIAEDNYFQTYLSTQDEFDVGAKTLLDVIDIQKNYNFSSIKRLQKEMNYKLSLFEAYNLVGNLPKIININYRF